MSLLNSIDRDHVLTAMETWDTAGGANYMLVRGGVSTHVLMHHGQEYDAADDPIFPLFLRVLELATDSVLPVPVDADGLDVEALAARLAAGERISAVYTVPDFHNPSQGTLTADRRRVLVALLNSTASTCSSTIPTESFVSPATTRGWRRSTSPTGRSWSTPSPRPWARGGGSAGWSCPNSWSPRSSGCATGSTAIPPR